MGEILYIREEKDLRERASILRKTESGLSFLALPTSISEPPGKGPVMTQDWTQSLHVTLEARYSTVVIGKRPLSLSHLCSRPH